MTGQDRIRLCSIAFKTLLVFFGVSGIIALLLITKTPLECLNLLSYFTIQSNLILIFVIGTAAVRLIRNKPETSLSRIIRNGSTLWITITGTVYHFMLSGLVTSGGLFQYSLIALHYVTPAMAILNWILFEEKGKSRIIHAMYWLLYPFAYTVFSEIRAAFDGFYPYWFLNPNAPYPKGTGSIGALAIAFSVLLAFFILSGFVIVGADNVLGRIQGKPRKAAKEEE